MPAITGTSSSYSVGSGGGNREDLEDTIHELFADENYFTSNFDKVKCSSTLHEWLGDELDAPAANIAVEGNDATFATISNPARYSNYLQILEKTLIVSETQDVVAKAGRRTETGRQAVNEICRLAA